MPSAFMNYGVTGRQQDGALLQQEEKNQKNPAREAILFRRCAVRSLLRRSMEVGSSDQRKRCLKNLKDHHCSFSALLGAIARVNSSVPNPSRLYQVLDEFTLCLSKSRDMTIITVANHV